MSNSKKHINSETQFGFWSYTELQELKFPEVQGLSSVGFKPKVFSEQNYLSKSFSWLKKERMSVKCLSCRDVSHVLLQIVTVVVTWSVYGESSHRLLIRGSSGLSYIFLQSNSHLHQFCGLINLAESYCLFHPSVRSVFRLFNELTLLSVHSHNRCNGNFRDKQPIVKMKMKLAAAWAPAKSFCLVSVLARTTLRSRKLGPSINVYLNRVIAGSVGGI